MDKRAYKFSDLIDTQALRRMMDDFVSATGFVVGIVDVEGRILVQAGYRRICTEFHRRHPLSERRCVESDTHISARLKAGDYVSYTCGNGLIDAAAPIIIDGEHLANIFTGQFFFEPPDEAYFIRQAELCGFDRESYLAELRRVPVVSRERYEAVMSFLTRFAEMLAELGLKMKRQKEAEAALLQSQKMEAIGRLAGGVAHDFNNLLQGIVGYGDLLRGELKPDGQGEAMLGHVLAAAERARVLVAQLLAFGHKEPEPRPEVLGLGRVVADMLPLMRGMIGDHIHVRFDAERSRAAVRAGRSQLEQVLLNLCVNARDAMSGGGTLTVTVRDEDVDRRVAESRPGLREGRYARLDIEDSGVGIPPDVLPHIFEPFFTTKELGKGSGLGLAIVYSLVHQNGGIVTVDSRPGRGSRFTVYWPAVSAPPAPEAAPPAEDRAPGGSETILLAEDNPVARSLAVDVLSKAGYRVFAAVDGLEAVRILESADAAVDLLVLDVLMPGRTGRDVHEAARARKMDVPVLFCSGYSADLIKSDYMLALPAGRLLHKPYSPHALLRAVRDLLDARPKAPAGRGAAP
jgi:signal transduction histidine kinase/CheY-like chemotaxis protein